MAFALGGGPDGSAEAAVPLAFAAACSLACSLGGSGGCNRSCGCASSMKVSASLAARALAIGVAVPPRGVELAGVDPRSLEDDGAPRDELERDLLQDAAGDGVPSSAAVVSPSTEFGLRLGVDTWQ